MTNSSSSVGSTIQWWLFTIQTCKHQSQECNWR